MSHRLHVVPEQRLLVLRAEGGLTLEALIACHRSLVAHPDFGAGFRVLLELAGASFPLSCDEIRRLAQEAPFSGAARTAVVVCDELHYGLVRMWDIVAGEVSGEICPFRTPEEACAWLDVSAEALRERLDPVRSTEAPGHNV